MSESPEATSESAGEGVAETVARLSQIHRFDHKTQIYRIGPGECGPIGARLSQIVSVTQPLPHTYGIGWGGRGKVVSGPHRAGSADGSSGDSGPAERTRRVAVNHETTRCGHGSRALLCRFDRTHRASMDEPETTQQTGLVATPSRADSLAYVGRARVDTTLRQPGTSFSHTLPSQFARRLRRLAHPSHALSRSLLATSRGARHHTVRLAGGTSG